MHEAWSSRRGRDAIYLSALHFVGTFSLEDEVHPRIDAGAVMATRRRSNPVILPFVSFKYSHVWLTAFEQADADAGREYARLG